MTNRRSRGEGTIYYSEKLERWVGQLTLPTGKKRTKYGKTQNDVKKWLLDQRKAVQDNVYVKSQSHTVESFLNRYMEDVAQHSLSPRTILSYQYLIKNHILPEIGDIKLTQLRADHLQRLYTDKLNAGLSKRTVQYIHQLLHNTLIYAVKWDLVIRNVADLAEPPSPPKEPAVILTASQAKSFLDQVKNDRLYSLYVCAISLGLREGELLALTWDDIDLDKKTIRINKQLQYIPGNGLSIKSPKTATSRRTLPLPDIAWEALRDHKQFASSDLIFSTSKGTPFSPRNILRHFQNTLKKLDYPRIPFHNLRHTCASFHLLAGTSPKVVQEILGHSSVSVTLGTYSHLLPGVQEEAAKKINQIFK